MVIKTLNQPRTLVELIRIPAMEIPSQIAIRSIFNSSLISESPAFLTYGQLWELSIQSALMLNHSGVFPGDRVLLIFSDHFEFIKGFFGIVLAGGIPIPYSPPLRLSKMENYREGFWEVVQDSAAKFCLTTARFESLIQSSIQCVKSSLELKFIHLTLWGGERKSEVLPDPKPSDLAILCYAVDQTQFLNGIMLTHGNIISNLASLVKRLSIGPEDIAVSWLPLSHEMGLIGMCLGSLYSCIPLYLLPSERFIRNPELWLKAISQVQGTVTAAPLFALEHCINRMKKDRFGLFNLGSLKGLLYQVDPDEGGIVERFNESFKRVGLRANALLPVYGLPECTLVVAVPELGKISAEEVDAEILERERLAKAPGTRSRRKRLVAVGQPLLRQKLQIVDEGGAPLRERQVGEIWVKGPSVMQGYFGKNKDTIEMMHDGWLRTGDLGYLAEGNLFLTSRLKANPMGSLRKKWIEFLRNLRSLFTLR